MAFLNCCCSKHKATGRFPRPTDQPAEQSCVPPLSENLKVDKKLKLSNENFKHTIDYFFSDKNITPLSQITATPTFPTPHVLAQFASKTYTEYEPGETDAQYETRLDLPDGWKLLTTASNSSKNNGYFGAAYWHPEHQQVVIAHRGTKLTNLGEEFKHVVRVMFKNRVPEMCSASTFTHKVVEMLRELNRTKGVSFELFFTGHNLGGWLAQITTFTAECLKIEGNMLRQIVNEEDGLHPHTVVFDSPGCKDMLSQMTNKYNLEFYYPSIGIEDLDITSYLSAPNRINSCNKHVGTVYRIFPDLSDMGLLTKNSELYNFQAHDMDEIVKIFDPETGQVSKDNEGNRKIKLVIHWPNIAGLRSCEHKRYFEWVKHFENYHPDITEEIFWLDEVHTLRYQIGNYEEPESSLNVFCHQERRFLRVYFWLCLAPNCESMDLSSAMGNNPAHEEAAKILQNFVIEHDKIRCTDGTALQALIPYVKRLLHLFPQVKAEADYLHMLILKWSCPVHLYDCSVHGVCPIPSHQSR